MNGKMSKRPNQSNCSTSGYSSQISDVSYDAKKSLSISSLCLNEAKIIRTSTPSNLVSNLQIGSLSTISSIQKPKTKSTFISSILKLILKLFACLSLFKKTDEPSSAHSFDKNLPKIVLKQQKLNGTPIRRQQAAFMTYSKPDNTYQVKTRIKQNSFISSTPNRPSYASFLFIDDKEIYDNMPSIESSQTSFNKAKYTVNTEISTTSITNDRMKSVPLLSSSPLSSNNLTASKSASSSVISSSSTSSGLQTSTNSYNVYNDGIYLKNIANCFQSDRSVSIINMERPIVPVYEDYLCDKEVESYFENPDYFDCYKNEVLLVKNDGKLYMHNFGCNDQSMSRKKEKINNYYYLNSNKEKKSQSISTSSGIISAATSASISTISSIKSNNSIFNYCGINRKYKGESYC